MHVKKSTTMLQITKPVDHHLMNFHCSRTSHSTQRISKSYLLVMSAKQFNPFAISTGRKKPFLQHIFRCSHPDCNKRYKSVNKPCIHFGKLPQCASFRMLAHNRQAQAELQPQLLEHLEGLTGYPWDDEESPRKLHEAVITNSMYDYSGYGAPNNRAGIYSESAHHPA